MRERGTIEGHVCSWLTFLHASLLRGVERIEREVQMNDLTPKTDLGLMSFYRLLAMSCVNSSFGPKKI
jgi:hypothetical protein